MRRRSAFTSLLVLAAGVLSAQFSAPVPAQAAEPAAAQLALSPTPYQGWNTYFGLGGDFTEQSVREVADALVSRGLAKAGYDIVWLDGGWQDPQPRTAAGDLQADRTRFPNGLAPLVRYIHGKGLRAGIYTDAGPYLPGRCGLGSYGYYQRDADQFAAWEFDAVKVDFLCGIAANLDPKIQAKAFKLAVTKFEKAGSPVTLDGVQATPYDVTIDPSKAPDVYGTALTQPINVVYYIGPDDLLRKMVYKDKNGDFVATYSDWGAPVTIEPPAASQVMSGMG